MDSKTNSSILKFTCLTTNIHRRQGEILETEGKKVYVVGNQTLEVQATAITTQWVRAAAYTGIYPPQQWRTELDILYNKYYTKTDERLNIQGLFTRTAIKKGELIGIYRGSVITTTNDYAMTIHGMVIDGTPKEGSKGREWMMSKINDWIWGSEGQNCTLRAGGIIVAKRDIAANEQLWMSYSDKYCWDAVSLGVLRRLPGVCRDILQVTGKEDFFRVELEEMETCIGGLDQGWRATVTDYSVAFRHLVDAQDPEHTHRALPRTEEGFLPWLHTLVLNVGFREVNAFRHWKPWEHVSQDWVCKVHQVRRGRHPRACQTTRNLDEDEGRILQLTDDSEWEMAKRLGITKVLEEDDTPGMGAGGDGQDRSQGRTGSSRTQLRRDDVEGPRLERQQHLTIGCYNAGNFTDLKQKDVIAMFEQHNFDAIFVIDAQMSDYQARHFGRILRTALGSKMKVLAAPTPTSTTVGGRVGGQLALFDTTRVQGIKMIRHDVRGAVVQFDLDVGVRNTRSFRRTGRV